LRTSRQETEDAPRPDGVGAHPRADDSTINPSNDADGISVQKTELTAAIQLVASTSYLVCTNNLTGYAQVLEEFRNDAAGSTFTVYTYGSDLNSWAACSSSTSAWDFNYHGHDGHGAIRFLTDAAGTMTDEWDYDAFGS